jgi:hypothetical protein
MILDTAPKEGTEEVKIWRMRQPRNPPPLLHSRSNDQATASVEICLQNFLQKGDREWSDFVEWYMSTQDVFLD